MKASTVGVSSATLAKTQDAKFDQEAMSGDAISVKPGDDCGVRRWDAIHASVSCRAPWQQQYACVKCWHASPPADRLPFGISAQLLARALLLFGSDEHCHDRLHDSSLLHLLQGCKSYPNFVSSKPFKW
jgi:hypothetical protein